LITIWAVTHKTTGKQYMRITILYQYFMDSNAPGHSLIYDFAHHCVNQGHEVTIITGETGYMVKMSPTQSWLRRLYRAEVCDGMTIIRTYTYPELHRSYAGRLMSFFSFSFSCLFGLLRCPKPDVLLASSPPIFPMFSGWLACRIRHIPMILEVRDLWPSSAVELGVLKSNTLIRLMNWLETFLYNRAAHIVTLTKGIKNNIVMRGWPQKKITAITCGVDLNALYENPLLREATREKYSWQNKQVILYFGAHGRANNLDVLLHTAQELMHHENILFVLVGDGMEKKRLHKKAQDLNINNIQFLPAISKKNANIYINAADICVATLQDIPLFQGAIPTKLIDYMACGKPVVIGIKGEAEDLISQAKCGISVNPDDHLGMATAINQLLSNPEMLQQMGKQGRQYIESHSEWHSYSETLLETCMQVYSESETKSSR